MPILVENFLSLNGAGSLFPNTSVKTCFNKFEDVPIKAFPLAFAMLLSALQVKISLFQLPFAVASIISPIVILN